MPHHRSHLSALLSLLLTLLWIAPVSASAVASSLPPAMASSSPPALLPALPPSGQAQNLPALDSSVWVPDGPVYAIQSDPASGRTFLGGDFDSLNPYTGHLLAAGLADPLAPVPAGFPVLDGPVYAIAGDAANGWYIGGDFHTAGGTPYRKNLLRLNPDLSLDSTWNVTIDGPVYVITLYTQLSGTWIYVGGAFSQVNGQPRSSLAALTKTGVLQAWTPNPDGPVRALLVVDTVSALFVGGAFHHLGRLAVNALGAVSLTGDGLATGWTPIPGLNEQAVVEALAVIPGHATYNNWGILAGGQFTVTPDGGTPVDHLAGWNYMNRQILSTLDFRVDGPVHALWVNTENNLNTFYVGGSFTHIGGWARAGLARLIGADSGDLTLDPSYDPGLDGAVYSIKGRATGTVIEQVVGGDFHNAKGMRQPGLARITYNYDPNYASLQVLDWSPRIQYRRGAVRAALLAGTRILAGGDFFSAGGSRRENLAALDASGQLIDGWSPGTDGPVHALAMQGDSLFFGGQFSHLDNQGTGKTCLNAGAASLTDGSVLDWCPDPDGAVQALAVYQHAATGTSVVLLGGEFQHVNDPSNGLLERPYLAMVRTDGAVADFVPAPDQPVRALAMQGSVLLAGGAFTTFNGVPAAYAAWIDLTGINDTYPLDPAGPVNAVSITRGQVYLAEDPAPPEMDPFLGRLEVFGWPPTGPALADLSGFRGAIHALWSDLWWVYTGGAVRQTGGESIPYLAAMDTRTRSMAALPGLLAARGEAVSSVEAIHVFRGRLMVGGSFGGAAGQEHPYFLVMPALRAAYYLPLISQ